MSLGIRRHRKRKLKSEINVVPYIDVMLVLLIIFMAVPANVTPNVVNLPSAEKSSLPPDTYIQITVKPDATLSIGVSGGSLALGAGVALDGVLGPFTVTAEGLGLELSLVDAPDGDGALGPFDAVLGFMPPSRIGLALESEVVSGGGVIDLDAVEQMHARAFELIAANALRHLVAGLGEITI